MRFTGEEFQLRDLGCQAIIRQLCVAPGQTRAGLAERLQLSRPTVAALVRRLLERGWLVEHDGVPDGRRGRCSQRLHLRSDRLALLGAAVGAAGVHVVASALTGEVLAQARCDATADVDACLDATARLLLSAQQRAGATGRRVVSIGVGLPGPVDEGRGCLGMAAAAAWRQLPVARLLTRRLRGTALQDMPLCLQSDAHVAALGEQQFGGRALQGAAALHDDKAVALGAAAFARHRLVHPLKAPTRLALLLARYGHRYHSPAGLLVEAAA